MNSSTAVFSNQGDPFPEPSKTRAHYHPSEAQQLTSEQKQTVLTPARLKPGIQSDNYLASDALSPTDLKFLQGSNRLIFRTSDTDSYDLFEESWPSTEASSSQTPEGLFQKVRMEKQAGSRESSSSKSPEIHSTADSVIAKYIERFRCGQPTSREERAAPREQTKEFWWLHASPPSNSSTPTDETSQGRKERTVLEYGLSEEFPRLPVQHISPRKDLSPKEKPSEVSAFSIDLETLSLQERAARLLQRSESSLNISAPVSSEGLGSSPSSYTASVEGESIQKPLIPSLLDPGLGTMSLIQWPRSVTAPPSAVHVLPSSGCRPEEDILFQWRLRRKMEQARDGALHINTRKKSLSPPVRLPKQVEEVQGEESAVVTNGTGGRSHNHAAAPPSIVLDMYPVASPALVEQTGSHSTHIPLHLHHICDLLPCLRQSQPEPAVLSQTNQESKAWGDQDGNSTELTPNKQRWCLVDERQKSQLLGTDRHQILSSGYKDKGLMYSSSHAKTHKGERGASGDQDSAVYPISPNTKQRAGAAQVNEGYRGMMTTLKAQDPIEGQRAPKPLHRLCQEHKKRQKPPTESSPVHSAMGQVISERLFSPPASLKSVGSRSMRRSRSRRKKPQAMLTPPVEPGPLHPLEMAALLLEQAEDSDGSEFQDDPLLQILRQQRNELRLRLREVAFQIANLQSPETSS
ncbi:proline and serine-rich protein 3 [Rhinatrema bivittatum]|uniref:proline and serine-rich protein 3 n=1 Tax=Rhinatrema bivittatum TaxID=194408 RepID=UPI00112C4748|nr:proline and serine-rich protein 3 [Rhinatrema bivittatum]XP_029432025.1 proline and serine-rich protein 3 [Rhinatrema bivittatum]